MEKAVFWDFDGTLALAESPWSRSVYQALKLALPDTQIEFTQIRRFMKSGFTWHTPFEDHTALIADAWWADLTAHFALSLEALGVDREIAHRISQTARELIVRPENYKLYPDAVPALERSNALGFKNVLLSNNFPELGRIVSELGIEKYFCNSVISSLVGFDKPRLEIFQAAKSLCPKAQTCFMVGDNETADIGGGSAAGMVTILVHKPAIAEADFCTDSLIGVVDFIDGYCDER